MGFEGDWESILRGDLWLPKAMVIDLIKKRPEFKEETILTDEQTEAVEKLRPHIKSEDE